MSGEGLRQNPLELQEIQAGLYLKLRRLQKADSPALFELIDKNREHLNQHGDDTAEKYPDLESVQRRSAEQNTGEYRYGIWMSDTLVGFIKLTELDETSTEIGYWLGSEYQGRGFMSDAVEELTAYAIDGLGYEEVVAKVEENNNKSQLVLIRAGFQKTGEETKVVRDQERKYPVFGYRPDEEEQAEAYWDDEDTEEREHWARFTKKLDRITGHFPNDPDPEVAQEVLEYLEEQGYGWKLHLNFDIEDQAVFEKVDVFLKNLKESSAIADYKIGLGHDVWDEDKGQHVWVKGPPGKQSTAYIGPKDKAQEIARVIGEGLSDVLIPPEGLTLTDDTPFTERVMARFAISPWDNDFYHYGPGGRVMLKVDVVKENLLDFGKRHNDVEWDRSRQPSQEAMERAEQLLVERYGTYYTGST